ncbi:type II toxin-antitoxin system RelE/ParE family toxin [Aulosira sp. FACHB-615]|uniref:type II toxin-antitoxin system RelE/ParE family toxin n=1 Tax=Aulosira sp. FACHB-615 TaxID=2692777 RepID=UPI0028C44795|nr:type II toxin-antitoxin system RelE/ParE family toxin [Aulosira sp. FACHB-615]
MLLLISVVRLQRHLQRLIFTAISLDDMKIPLGNKLEALQSDREGQNSIRINKQYRICFVWTNEGACEVENHENT